MRRESAVAIGLIALIVVVHAAVRLGGHATLTPDEAEQVLYAQSLAWGYRPRNPPLYSWLVWGAERVTFDARQAVVLAKYLCLTLGLAALYAAARRILGTGRRASIALWTFCATLFAGFHVHQNYANTMAAFAAAAGIVWAGARIVQRKALIDYALFGVIAGLGVSAKYNVIPALLLMGAAAWSVREMREALRPSGLILACAALLAVAGPAYLWLAQEGVGLLALYQDVSVTDARDASPVAAWDDVAWAFATLVSPAGLLALLLFPEAWRSPASPTWGLRWTRRQIAAALITVLVATAALGSTSFADRWLVPLLVAWPIALWAGASEAVFNGRRSQAFVAVCAALLIAGVAARPMVDLIQPARCGRCDTFAPYEALAADVRALGFQNGDLVAESETVLGNMLSLFPAARAVTPLHPQGVYPPGHGGGCLVLWGRSTAPRTPALAPSEAFARAFARRFDAEAPTRPDGALEAPLLGAPDRLYRIAYAWRPNGLGTCGAQPGAAAD